MGGKATQEWWETLAHCGGTIEAIGDYRKINKQEFGDLNIENGRLMGNWAVFRLMIDNNYSQEKAFEIASPQYVGAKEFEKKEMEKAFKENQLNEHFDQEIAKCEKYGQEYIRSFPELFQ